MHHCLKSAVPSAKSLLHACFVRRLGCSGTRANEGVNHCTRLRCVEHGGAKELVPLHVLNEHSGPIDVNDFRAFQVLLHITEQRACVPVPLRPQVLAQLLVEICIEHSVLKLIEKFFCPHSLSPFHPKTMGCCCLLEQPFVAQ